MLAAHPGLHAALADRYTLQAILGAGGTSTVYRARDEKHGRDVAIKVLRPDLAASFSRERSPGKPLSSRSCSIRTSCR